MNVSPPAVTVVASGAEISGYVTRTAEQKWTYSLKSDRSGSSAELT